MNNEFNMDMMISIEGSAGNNLYMYYDNNKLCMEVDNYGNNHNVYIMHNNKLYVPLKKLFNELRVHDAMRNINRNKFEWISEGEGIPEAQNRMIIHELNGAFVLSFMKNKYNLIDGKDMCSISFANNSKNKAIVEAFNKMFLNLCKMETLNSEVKNSLLK